MRLVGRNLNLVSASTVLAFAVLGCFVIYAPCLPSFVQGFQLMTLRKRLN
jgi:hypothetical protein